MLAAPPQELTYGTHIGNNSQIGVKKSANRAQKKPRQKIKILGMVLLALMICFGMTFLATLVVSQGYKAAKIKQEINVLQRENERLQLEVARLKAPERIVRIAVDRLNMVKPQKEQICYVPGQDNADAHMIAAQASEEKIESVAVTSQSWLQMLAQTLQQWLNPVHVAGISD